MDETILAEIQSLTADLRKKLEAPQDFIKKAEVEAMVTDMVAKMHPKQESKFSLPADTVEGVIERYEAFKNRPEAYAKATPWTSEYGKKFTDMAGFIRAARAKSSLLEDAKAIMSEGDNAQGGYLVPTEFNYEVMKLMGNESIGRRICRVLPMSTWKRTFSKQLTNVSVYWVNEAAAKTVTKPTFGQFTQQCKVMAAVMMLTDELLRDSAINLQSFLAELIVEAMAAEEDRLVFVGNTGAGDPFMGVRYAVGVVANTMAGASLVYRDLLGLEFSIAAGYRKNGIYVLPSLALRTIMTLSDNTGRPLWSSPVNGAPATINGFKYEVSDNISAIATKYPVLFGDFKRAAYISPRTGLQIKVSQDAYDAGTGENAFMNDETWLRFTQAESINIAIPAAFGYLDVK